MLLSMGQCLGHGTQDIISHATVFGSSFEQLWQDRQIRWDQGKNMISLRNGEECISHYEGVEDTKGDNGIGKLEVTLLRIIWTCSHTPKLNLSIGLSCVTYIHYNVTDSNTFGRVRAATVMTNFNNTRFEFAFAVRSDVSLQLFNQLEAATRRFRATRMFRELVLRDTSVVKDGEVNLQPYESIVRKIDHCDNLTADVTFPGVLVITEYRLIWIASRGGDINASVPYVQIKSISSRHSSFGTALVVETLQASGAYILGFRLSPSVKLQEVIDLCNKKLKEQKTKPFYGPLDGSIQFMEDRFVVVLETNESTQEDDVGSTAIVNTIVSHPPSAVTPVMDNEIYAPLPTTRDITENSEMPRRIYTDPMDTHPGSQTCPSYARDNIATPTFINTLSQQIETMRGEDRSVGVFVDSAFTPTQNMTRAATTSLHFNRNSPSNWRLPNIAPTRSPKSKKNAMRHLPTGSVPLNLNDKAQAAEAVNFKGQDVLMSPASKKYLRGPPKCVICMADPDEAALDPCGHICTCMRCATQIAQCPICRTDIQKVLRIYITA